MTFRATITRYAENILGAYVTDGCTDLSEAVEVYESAEFQTFLARAVQACLDTAETIRDEKRRQMLKG